LQDAKATAVRMIKTGRRRFTIMKKLDAQRWS
jgi:hypothetical protein